MGKRTTSQVGVPRIVRTARGARLWHGRHLVSEVRKEAGPTDSVFDLLAACAHAVSPLAGRVAVLGFAAGGLVAPLRALGSAARVEGVDLDTTGAELFHEVAKGYAGEVEVWRADACAWLEARPGLFDVVVEDLSAQVPGDVVKPAVSLEALPARIEACLSASGAVVVNALPTPGHSWTELIQRLVGRWPQVRVCSPAEYQNRVLVAGAALPGAQALGRAVRERLHALGSVLGNGLTVQRFEPHPRTRRARGPATPRSLGRGG